MNKINLFSYIRTVGWVIATVKKYSPKLFFMQFFFGFLGVVCQYAALYLLAIILHDLARLYIDQVEIIWRLLYLKLTACFILLAVEAIFTRRFYSTGYKLWSVETKRMSLVIIQLLRTLPNKLLGKVNQILLSNELSILSAGRPQAFGAFLFYFSRNVIDWIKVLVLIIVITILDYRFTMLLALIGGIGFYFTISRHRRVTILAHNIEQLQLESGKERIEVIRNANMDLNLKKTEQYFDSVVNSYFQVRLNQAVMSFVSAIFLVSVVCLMILLEAKEKIVWDELLLVFLFSRILMGSVIQFTNGILMMNRQYTQVIRLKRFIEKFNLKSKFTNELSKSLVLKTSSGKDIILGKGEPIAFITKSVFPNMTEILCLFYSLEVDPGSLPETNRIRKAPLINRVDEQYQYYCDARNILDENNLYDKVIKRFELFGISKFYYDVKDINQFSEITMKNRLLIICLMSSLLDIDVLFVPKNYFHTIQRVDVDQIFLNSAIQLFVLYYGGLDQCDIKEQYCFLINKNSNACIIESKFCFFPVYNSSNGGVENSVPIL